VVPAATDFDCGEKKLFSTEIPPGGGGVLMFGSVVP
jgi:hypothetical protein